MTQYKMPGDHVISVNHNFGAVTDYYPICDSPNGSGGTWGYRFDLNKPKIHYTWYDEYLWRRYEEMRRLANMEAKKAGKFDPCKQMDATEKAIREDVHQVDVYARAFFDRYLRNRKYYRGSDTART